MLSTQKEPSVFFLRNWIFFCSTLRFCPAIEDHRTKAAPILVFYDVLGLLDCSPAFLTAFSIPSAVALAAFVASAAFSVPWAI
jgi:hypothetical protein